VIHVRHESINPELPIFVPGTKNVQFVPAITPLADEPVVLKNRPNAFFGTNLKQILDDNKIDTMTIVGTMSHMCIDATVRAASDMGYPVTVIHDACATRDLEFNGQTVPAQQVHIALMSALAFAYARVVSTQEYLNV